MPTQQQIINAIYAIAPKHNADPALMVADARVESGLNPGAVGDHGTSFGLWQDHIGGAGGRTKAEASQYLNWRKAIEHAAKRFAGAHTAADAYGVQRPADRAGYIAKVRAALHGGSPGLNAPVTGGAVAPAGAGGEADPVLASILARRGMNPVVASMLAEGDAAVPVAAPASGGAPVPPGGKIDYRWIQHMGQKLFGLRNDPGDSQLTGGHHTAGSEHYKQRAVDFGTARNSAAKLAAWQKWAKAHGLDVLNEGDHIHVSAPGGGI